MAAAKAKRPQQDSEDDAEDSGEEGDGEEGDGEEGGGEGDRAARLAALLQGGDGAGAKKKKKFSMA